MKPGESKLNPQATPYVPVSKREGYLDDKELRFANPSPDYVQHNVSVQGMGNFPKEYSEIVYPQMRDDDLDIMDMDLHYLFASFTDLSHESIDEVYLANNGDLDATIEMLHELEIFSNEADHNLPDTLDIGDVPETINPTATASASNQSNASNEASASSSSSSGITNPSVSSS